MKINYIFKIITLILVLGNISILGYCGLFDFFNKHYEENYPIKIPLIQAPFNYHFEQDFVIRREDSYGFFFVLGVSDYSQKKQVINFFRDKGEYYEVYLKIYDQKNKLVKSIEAKTKLYSLTPTNIYIELYRFVFKKGEYRVSIILKDNKSFVFYSTRPYIQITNGHRPK